MEAGKSYFVDTNILLCATDSGRVGHASAWTLFERAASSGAHLALSGQVLREYLVVATRPVDANGLGLSVSAALANSATFRARAVFCEEDERVRLLMERLVREAGLTGKRIHDANIAATALTHGHVDLITENPGDFETIPGLVVHSLASTSP